MKLLSIFFFSLLVSGSAFANSWMLLANDPKLAGPPPPGYALQKMLTLSNDRDAYLYHMHLMVPQNGMPAGLFVAEQAPNNADDLNGKPFWLNEIESRDGVVLLEGEGRKVLLMQGLLNRTTKEGRFHLKYLANGLSMKYESCDFILRNNAGKYWVQNAYTGEKVEKIHVVTYFLGISTLQGVCPKQKEFQE
ncbi:MAG TPA: hypothetical protein VIH99_04615 [Bdellovibrionota bacterium]|jgi:hypothetical protein